MKVRETYEYLESVEMVNAFIENKVAEKEQLFTMATKTTQANDGMPHASGTSDKVGMACIKIAELDDQITDTIDMLNDFRFEVIHNIEKLEPKQYDVLHKHYVQGIPLGEIADRKGISRQWINELRKKGVNNLSNTLVESDLYRRVKRMRGTR